MTDITKIVVIETNCDVIIKEKEGINKRGEPKQTRVSNFRNVEHALDYLTQKLSVRKG